MLRKFAVALVALSFIAGPALAQSNAPATGTAPMTTGQPAKVDAKQTAHNHHVVKKNVAKAPFAKKHIAKHHVKKMQVSKHVKHAKSIKHAKRVKPAVQPQTRG
jgi:hypothetical protein